MFSFFKAVAADPGFIKNDISREKQHRFVEELADENCLDVRHFCLTCLVRKTIAFCGVKSLYTDCDMLSLDQEAFALKTL